MKGVTHFGKARMPLHGILALLVMLASVVAPAIAGESVPGVEPAFQGAGSVGQVSLSLMLVIGLLLAVAWLMRRLGRLQPPGAANLRVLGGLRLGARERVLLLSVADRRLLVGASPAGLRTLLVLDEGAQPTGSATFAAALAKIGEKQ